MRLLISLTLTLLAILFVGFVLTNLNTQVTIRVWGTDYPDIHIWVVVWVSIAVGIVFATFIAFIEGARARFDNRKLRREVHKLETEINYLRTQPRPGPAAEPDALERREPEPRTSAPALEDLPSAPVYGMDDEEDPPLDPDDDIYTGGRAV